MAKISRIYQKIQQFLRRYFPHFAGETILFLFLITAAACNLLLRANSASAQNLNRSLFFVYLKSHPEMNVKLVDTYESLSEKLSMNAGAVYDRQILGAVTRQQDSADSQTTAAATPLATLSGTTVLKPNPAGSSVLPKRDIAVYEVRPGDTVARIAASYGVSEYTITEENGLNGSALIKPGQELRILPTSGIQHTIKDGETLEGIAKKYNADMEEILEYNEIEFPEFILPGEEIIIPGGVNKKPVTPQRQQYLADLQREDVKRAEVPSDFAGDGEYVWPLPGAHRLSQSYKRSHPGIDVPCRDCEIVSAGDGIVELSGWQKGYGNTVVINHGGGRKTRYAHASNLMVSAGERVTAGQVIMISGSTGRSTGPHLHFEIIESGARVNPLSKVK